MTSTHPTILVVEDEALLLQAITQKLQLSGYQVISCSGGSQAINQLQNQSSVPSLIWLDYYLNDMNGLEFMGQIKQNQLWRDIPVIVVSNSASNDKVKTMLALGAKKYLLKAEYRLDDIIKTIATII